MTYDGRPPTDDDYPLLDLWDDGEELDTDPHPAWRRPLLIAVAIVTAVALALVPIYNVFFTSTIADNGLEVCGFDYCVVEDAVRVAGMGSVMSRMFHSVLSDEEAVTLAGQLTDHLGIDPVAVVVVDDLEGRVGGVFDPATRSIAIERPARAWTVMHEVAHAVETDHGAAFQKSLIDLMSQFGGE